MARLRLRCDRWNGELQLARSRPSGWNVFVKVFKCIFLNSLKCICQRFRIAAGTQQTKWLKCAFPNFQIYFSKLRNLVWNNFVKFMKCIYQNVGICCRFVDRFVNILKLICNFSVNLSHVFRCICYTIWLISRTLGICNKACDWNSAPFAEHWRPTPHIPVKI